MSRSPLRLPALILLGVLAACGHPGGPGAPLTLAFLPPAEAMPVPGATVVFGTRVAGGAGPVSLQWLRDGVPLPGATGDTLTLAPVAYGNAGAYQVQATDGLTTLVSPPYILEPVDRAWVVTLPDDDGPGTRPWPKPPRFPGTRASNSPCPRVP